MFRESIKWESVNTISHLLKEDSCFSLHFRWNWLDSDCFMFLNILLFLSKETNSSNKFERMQTITFETPKSNHRKGNPSSLFNHMSQLNSKKKNHGSIFLVHRDHCHFLHRKTWLIYFIFVVYYIVKNNVSKYFSSVYSIFITTISIYKPFCNWEDLLEVFLQWITKFLRRQKEFYYLN